MSVNIGVKSDGTGPNGYSELLVACVFTDQIHEAEVF
jgi:hypothetical protein